MPRSTCTQTRTFVYGGKYLLSATNPENGTVNYTYTANGKIATKTDAKNQQIVYTYDAYLRLTQIQRYPTPGNEDICQRTTFSYDTNPIDGSFSQYAWGRTTAVQYGIPMSLLSTGGGCPSGVPYALADQYSYTPAGLVTKKRLSLTANVSPQSTTLRTANLDTSQTYDSQGRVLTVTYPDAKAYTYAYDGVSRPVSLTDNQPTPVAWVNNVQYGLSGELLQMTYAGTTEVRTYNSRLQLTAVGSMEYRYSPTQNNGQITQQKDWSSGEEVTYAYDSLQRLISAVTTDSPTVPQWGQAFTYDGFGNRTSASVTKGSAPYGNWTYDPATNRMAGFYDANGNMTLTGTPAYNGYSYDVENRLVSVPASNQDRSGYEQYAYDPGNKRIYKRTLDGTEELYFYGISGQKLGTYRPWVYQYGVSIATVDTNLYFGSRTIVSRGVVVTLDRLGSNRAGGSRYFPYGEEQQVTAQDRDKFATYYRDGNTGLDYAQNRYYASTLGRFTSPDPYKASGGPSDPRSWNRYTYVQGDPVNLNDPTGLSAAASDAADCGPDWATDASLTGPCTFDANNSSYGHISVDTWRESGVQDSIHSLGDLVSNWQWANPQTTAVYLSFAGSATDVIIGICAAQPELCVVVAGGALTIYVTATYLPQLINAIKLAESLSERYIRCLNEYLQDLKNCSQAYPPGDERQKCFLDAKEKYNRCRGIGVH